MDTFTEGFAFVWSHPWFVFGGTIAWSVIGVLVALALPVIGGVCYGLVMTAVSLWPRK